MLQEGTESLTSVEGEAIAPRIYYQKLAFDTLKTLWAHAPWIAAGVVGALALASVALLLVGPRYTGRAMIQFKFVREEPEKTSKIATTATVDAMAVLNDAAPIIRSHAIAGAVVARLALDKDPAFVHGARLWRVFSGIRSHLGYETTGPKSRDLAEEQLIRQIKVTSDPRSYLVSIAVTASDPEWAAKLANAVALEYLRAQLLQQVNESYAAGEREMSEISSIYGVNHPTYQSEQAKLDVLRLQLKALREGSFDEAVANRVAGEAFVAAQKVMVPSGPNILLILGLTAAVALGVGGWLALQPLPNLPWRVRWPNVPRRVGWPNVSWRVGWPNLPWGFGRSNVSWWAGWSNVSWRAGWPNLPWPAGWPNLPWRAGWSNLPWRIGWRGQSHPAAAGSVNEPLQRDGVVASEPTIGANDHIDLPAFLHHECLDE